MTTHSKTVVSSLAVALMIASTPLTALAAVSPLTPKPKATPTAKPSPSNFCTGLPSYEVALAKNFKDHQTGLDNARAADATKLAAARTKTDDAVAADQLKWDAD